jgi:hypothetical protein
MDTDELMSIVCPKINDQGWAFYFTPETAAVGQAMGLDIAQFYFLGRAGVLGEVDAQVIASALGYFNPELLTAMWDSAKAIADPREAGHAFMTCSAELGREKFSGLAALGVTDLEAFVAAAEKVNTAADPLGLALYAGVAAEPLVRDTEGRAMQLITVLREFRGGVHLLAIRANGLDGKTAHFIKRPTEVALFGWSEDDPPVITDRERQRWAAAEALTNELVRPAFAVLDEKEAAALVEGMQSIERALTA